MDAKLYETILLRVLAERRARPGLRIEEPEPTPRMPTCDLKLVPAYEVRERVIRDFERSA